MGKLKRVLFIVLGLSYFQGTAQTISYGGKDLFLNGVNIAWNNYGWDFGDNHLNYGGGNGYDPIWWDETFTEVESFGGNCVRIWVHCKGEFNPLFDGSGKCTGLNVNFFENLDDVLQKAENHNLLVILCLFDFHLVDISGRQDLVKDTSKTNSYIKNALIPMVQRYNNQCNLLAWEIINEPEWIMQGVSGAGNYGSSSISSTQMQRFVGLCASAIHQNTWKYVTVGSASIKWNASITPAVGNYWSDQALRSATYNDWYAFIDFYQIHYYDWMGTSLSPYSNTKSYWAFDKPTIIGETGNEGYYTYQQQYNFSHSNGYAGCFPWAYKSGGAATWNEFKNSMKNFRDNHTSIVDVSCDVLSSKPSVVNSKSGFDVLSLIRKGEELHINNIQNIYSLRLINLRGVEVFNKIVSINTENLVIPEISESGLLLIIGESPSGTISKKIIVE
jgi:hypothetical protein